MIAAEGLPVQLATRVLGVPETGYYEWRGRAPSARAVRHAWLTGQIQAVHLASRGTYGPGGCMPSSPSAWASPSATARWNC